MADLAKQEVRDNTPEQWQQQPHNGQAHQQQQPEYLPNASISQQQQRSFMSYPQASVPSSNDGSGSSPYAFTSPQPSIQHQQQNLWIPRARPQVPNGRTDSSLVQMEDASNGAETDTQKDCITKGVITYEAAERYSQSYISLSNDPKLMNWLAYIHSQVGDLADYRSYSPLFTAVVCAIGATNLGEQADSDALLAEARNLSRILLWPSEDNLTNRNLGDLWSGVMLATYFGAKLVGPLISLSRTLGCHTAYARLREQDKQNAGPFANEAYLVECLRAHLVLCHYDAQFNLYSGCPPLTPLKGIQEQAEYLVSHRYSRPVQDNCIKRHVTLIVEMAKAQSRLDPSFSLGHRDYDQICDEVGTVVEDVTQTWEKVFPDRNFRAVYEDVCPKDQLPPTPLLLRFNLHRTFIYSCPGVPMVASRSQEIASHPGRLRYTLKSAAVAKQSLDHLVETDCLFPSRLFVFHTMRQCICAPAQVLFSVAFALPDHLDLNGIRSTFTQLIPVLSRLNPRCPYLQPISQLLAKLEEMMNVRNQAGPHMQNFGNGQQLQNQVHWLDPDSEALLENLAPESAVGTT